MCDRIIKEIQKEMDAGLVNDIKSELTRFEDLIKEFAGKTIDFYNKQINANIYPNYNYSVLEDITYLNNKLENMVLNETRICFVETKDLEGLNIKEVSK